MNFTDSFWSEIGSLIQSERIILDLVQKENRRIEEEKRKLSEQRLRIEEENRKQEEQKRKLNEQKLRIEEENRQREERKRLIFASDSRAPNYGFSTNNCSESSPKMSFVSNGSAHGREVKEGPNGGLYYKNNNGNRTYAKSHQVRRHK